MPLEPESGQSVWQDGSPLGGGGTPNSPFHGSNKALTLKLLLAPSLVHIARQPCEWGPVLFEDEESLAAPGFAPFYHPGDATTPCHGGGKRCSNPTCKEAGRPSKSRGGWDDSGVRLCTSCGGGTRCS